MYTTSITGGVEKLSTTEGRDIFFPVFEQDIVGITTGLVSQQHKMLTRGDGYSEQDHFLGIVGKNYRVVENWEILMPLQEQMINYFDPIVLDDVVIKDHITKKGALCFAEYILPSINGEVETNTGHKTNVGLRFIMKNAFNSSSSVVFYSGDIDFFCTNGQINGMYDVTKRKHTRNFAVDGFIEAFEMSLDHHKNTVEQYQKWADSHIYDSKKVMNLFRKLTSGTTDDPKRTNVLSDRLFAQYVDEVRERGSNVVSVVSSMTNYGSHGGEDTRFSLTRTGDDGTLLKRQEQVSKWLGSKVFADFLEAA